MHKKFLRQRLIYAFLCLCYTLTACSSQYSNREDVQQFINKVSTKDNFDRHELAQLFNTVKTDPVVLKTMTRPSEAKPWASYRKIFLTQKKIVGGAEFWDQHADTLRRAEKQFGVPSRVMVAILGVETQYGQHQGNFKVFNTLSTLGFDYPPRAKYFRYELEQYLLLTRQQGFPVLQLEGSYAGALGEPQFMPSSYRDYAIDYSGDGKADLFNNSDDAIGSIGNYLQRKGWQRGQPITMRANVTGHAYTSLPSTTKPTMTLKELARYGITPVKPMPENTKAIFMAFDNGNEIEYWLGFENFAVIMRYNTSRMYALAVDQLGVKIANMHHEALAANDAPEAIKPTELAKNDVATGDTVDEEV